MNPGVFCKKNLKEHKSFKNPDVRGWAWHPISLALGRQRLEDQELKGNKGNTRPCLQTTHNKKAGGEDVEGVMGAGAGVVGREREHHR